MIYSPHTFELTLELGYAEYDRLLDRAYKKAKKKHQVYKDTQNNNIHYDNSLKQHGIRVMYKWNKYKKKIKLIVNPSKILGGDDIPKLWKPSKDNISEMLNKLDTHINTYFDSEYEIDDLKLTRMDFTVNFNVGSRKSVSDYITVLHRIGKVRGFTPVRDVGCINNELAFVLKGNSNNIQLMIYDKEGWEKTRKDADSRPKAAKGILRAEVQISTNTAFLDYTDEESTSKQIKDLARNSEIIFMDIFERAIPRGDFYKKDKVIKKIEDYYGFTKKETEKMLRLVELIPKKKSLLLAQNELNIRNVKAVMKNFKILDISPVTISKRHDTKFIKSLYKYLSPNKYE